MKARGEATQVGFFHFGKRALERPIEQLEESLLEKARSADLSNTVLVLPEAFNLPGDYSTGKARDHDQAVACRLSTLSKTYGIAFVAGLIDGPTREVRYNTAHLINDADDWTISSKSFQDGFGGYLSLSAFQPREHRNLLVASLICNDAITFPKTPEYALINSNQAHALSLRDKHAPALRAVLCISAHFTGSQMVDQVVKRFSKSFDTVVLANSSTNHPSLICVDDRLIADASRSLAENLIEVRPIPTTKTL